MAPKDRPVASQGAIDHPALLRQLAGLSILKILVVLGTIAILESFPLDHKQQDDSSEHGTISVDYDLHILSASAVYMY